MTHCRGIALTVIGDNSGADLVFSLGNRQYVVPVNFSGPRTIGIPNGEVFWYKSGYGFNAATSGSYDYSGVSRFQLFLGRVPASVTANVQVTAIQTMQEDQTTGLVNPIMTLNSQSVQVSGIIPYNNYLTYAGGATAQVYDQNWNYWTNLPVSGATLTAVNGNNTFSVSASNSPNAWMATRVKVSGTPWPVNKPSPTHEWRFENNTLDVAGTANGTASNAPAYVPGIEGAAALSFNGINQYVNVPNVSDFQFTSNQSFTLSAWVKLNNLPNARVSIVQKNPAGGAAYGLGVTASNQWAFFGTTDIVSPFTADIGQWHLVAAVQDGTFSLRKLYVDGLLLASGMAQDASGSGALGIGATPDIAAGQFLNGSVDDVRLCNQPVSVTDINLMATNLAAATMRVITYSVNGGHLVLDWPANQLLQLQVQTNGLNANWLNVIGATPPYAITNDSAIPTAFYRLVKP
jgi:hypothetical protein